MKQKDILFILLSTTFVVALWIVFGIVHSSISSTISSTLSQAIQPIPGTFDTKTLNSLKSRQKILPQSNVVVTPTPTPTPTPPPVSPVLPLQVNQPVSTQGGSTQ